jgi:hypothetical protein
MAESSNKNEDNKMTNEKLRINLRKMVKSFDNYIKDANDYDQLEDNLKHMEETDENFHKYFFFILFGTTKQPNLINFKI